MHRRAIQRQACESALRARICEDLSVHLPVGVGRSMTAYRPGSRGSVAADLELTAEQVLHALVVLEDHDQVNAFHADLKAPASAFDREERRRAPAACGAAGRHAA